LQIATEIKRVDADRFLADLVRSGALGAALRDGIASSMVAAIMDLKRALPAAGKDSAKAQSARFESTREGELSAIVSGEMRISEEQTKLLGNQLKEQLASRAVIPQ
jgi:phosphohistidine phosphatase SixA